ncbi:hypothetical protein [Plantactinospora endophytica]|uniref:WXG100 family type VII secretion target n=1 Tax=Plantactinospora endophytica TaxID=673535 RepID=A0ABQ4E156_9ACTN|nr:hypothetical protein [Plantactinospora endophytica]GIG88462.1 hypothetical protein Pen02_33980 [Plantactinospora endophytica]
MSSQIRMVHGEAEAAAMKLKKHGINIEVTTKNFVADLAKIPWDSDARAEFEVWKRQMEQLWNEFHQVVLKAGTVVSDASESLKEVDRKAAALMSKR